MRVFIQPIETSDVAVKCDGGGLPLGHPAIFLNLTREEKVVCPYCSQLFVKVETINKNSSKKKRKDSENKS